MAQKRKKRKNPVKRIMIVTLAAMVIIASDVFFVSVLKKHLASDTDLSEYAKNINIVTKTDQAMRGVIYDRNGNVIAQDTRTYDIRCILARDRMNADGTPAHVVDVELTAETLCKILKMDKQKIINYLTPENSSLYQVELGSEGRYLSKKTKEEIEKAELPGIEFETSVQRIYTYGQFASNLIGYAQSNEDGTATVGKMGFEKILDNYLTGEDGYSTSQVDKNGYSLPGMKNTVVPAVNGKNVYLTLDATIQEQLETSLSETTKMWKNCDRAWGAVMEIKTGKVIGWGQTPTFNANNLESIPEYNNMGAQLPYEAGSTMKTFVWAAAINEGKYESDELSDGNVYYVGSDSNNNPVRGSAGKNYGSIYNAHRTQYGMIDNDRGLISSLNTVALHLQNEVITPEIHMEYLKNFGFWENVDTDGLTEGKTVLNFNSAMDKAALSYGQGSTVTMLQLLQAYSAVFSDGTMVKPYFVETIADENESRVLYQAETEKIGNPITEESAKKLQEILCKVVSDVHGTAKYYQIPECDLMGKTGTSEVAKNASYESGQTISSVMLAMPADNPQVIVYYAFQADYNADAPVKTEPVRELLRTVAMTYGFTKENNKDVTTDDDSKKVITDLKTYDMPDLCGKSVKSAKKAMKSYETEVVVLGKGDTVVKQYPKDTGTVNTGQRVFLLTDEDSFEMPDLTGWTRKDVSSLWAVSMFGFKLEGQGVVKSQSIPAGTTVTKGTEIEVVFDEK